MGPKGRGFNGGRRILIVGGDRYGLKKVGLLLNFLFILFYFIL